jgi:3-deoxy-D-manno-octulosonate 8-phosphate phosphatase (KDO 8-P phosphatase)
VPETLDSRAARIKLLVFDVDGVMTDGGLYYGPTGEALKRFDVKDGHALVLARLTGLPSAILTARTSEIVQVRAHELKLAKVMQGKKDKGPALDELCRELNLTPMDCAYMGDDVNDLGPMQKVALAACPADAAPEVRAFVHYVAPSAGGRGAVRDLTELVLKATGRWKQALELLGAGALHTL